MTKLSKKDVQWYLDNLRHVTPPLTEDQSLQVEAVFNHLINDVVEARDALKKEISKINKLREHYNVECNCDECNLNFAVWKKIDEFFLGEPKTSGRAICIVCKKPLSEGYHGLTKCPEGEQK